MTLLQKKYYKAIYDKNRMYLENDGTAIAQLVNITVCSFLFA